MKKSILIAGIAALSIVACKKETKETMSENDSIAKAKVDTAAKKMDSLGNVIDKSAQVTKDAVNSAATATTEKGAEAAKEVVKGANQATEKAADVATKAANEAKDAVKTATK